MSNKKKGNVGLLILIISLVGIIMTGCADLYNVKSCLTGEESGFFYGVIHGTFMLFSLIGSLFDNTITIYDINNNGNAYNFGYVLGANGIIGIVLRTILTSNDE